MTIAQKLAITIWAIGMMVFVYASWRDVIVPRGFQLHDVLLVMVGIAAPSLTLYVWLVG